MQQPEPNNGPNQNPPQVTLEYKTTGNITGVPRIQNLTFRDKETMDLWWSQLEPLRNEQTRLMLQGNPSQQDGLSWLASFRTFHNHWGSGLVPLDVRNSVHHTQAHLGLPLTQW